SLWTRRRPGKSQRRFWTRQRGRWLASSTSATAASGRRPSFLTPRAAISCSPAGTTRARAGCARWSRRASPGWRGAASATMWAAGSTATRWTTDELRAALNDEKAFQVIRRVYDVEVPGEMQHDHEKNVLWWKQDPADAAEWQVLREALGRLKAARGRRKSPYVDTTPYVNWNAMMAAAFLQAGAGLDRPECNTLALKVLRRVWAGAWA